MKRRRLRDASKRALLRVPVLLRRPLLRAAWRSRELYRSARAHGQDGDVIASVPGAARWPIPPADLRVLVSGDAELGRFLRTGKAQAQLIGDLFAGNGMAPERLGSMLDFGCGCGRVARWWDLEGPEVHGCDYNRRLVDWCARNLAFMHAEPNGLEPPLPYEDQRFDAIYAISVFTHLPMDLQDRWLGELKRVLRPDGALLFTVHGEAYRYLLSDEERRAFASGEPVTHFDELRGSNVCATYQPPAYVERRMLTGLDLLDAVRPTADDPEAAKQGNFQDTYVARKPA